MLSLSFLFVLLNWHFLPLNICSIFATYLTCSLIWAFARVSPKYPSPNLSFAFTTNDWHLCDSFLTYSQLSLKFLSVFRLHCRASWPIGSFWIAGRLVEALPLRVRVAGRWSLKRMKFTMTWAPRATVHLPTWSRNRCRYMRWKSYEWCGWKKGFLSFKKKESRGGEGCCCCGLGWYYYITIMIDFFFFKI